MPAENKNRLYLHEALELRGEYDARIQTIKDCLAKGSGGGGRASLWHEDSRKRRPSPDFDVADERARLRTLGTSTLNPCFCRSSLIGAIIRLR